MSYYPYENHFCKTCGADIGFPASKPINCDTCCAWENIEPKIDFLQRCGRAWKACAKSWKAEAQKLWLIVLNDTHFELDYDAEKESHAVTKRFARAWKALAKTLKQERDAACAQVCDQNIALLQLRDEIDRLNREVAALSKPTAGGWYIEPDDSLPTNNSPDRWRIVSHTALLERMRSGSSARPKALATVYSRADAEAMVSAHHGLDLAREERDKAVNLSHRLANALECTVALVTTEAVSVSKCERLIAKARELKAET